MKVLLLTTFYLISLCGHCTTDFSCNTHATILRQMEREGFHVDVQSLIELLVEVEDAYRWENCSVALREHIPDAFYVNPDQLSELHRSGLVHACTLDKVDVEAPQYLATRHTVYVYGRFSKSQNLIFSNLKYPLHLRYQNPKSGGGYSSAELKSPTLLVRCENMPECAHLMKSKAPCQYCGPELCDWMRINYKTNAPNFTLSVPVGNMDHVKFVAFVTYFLTFGGCLYVTLALFINNSWDETEAKLPVTVLGSGEFIISKLLNHREIGAQALSNMLHEKRHFDNPYPEFTGIKESTLIDEQTKNIHPRFMEKLRTTSQELLRILEKNMPSHKRDGSVYTGSAGIALLYFLLSEKTKNETYLERASEFIEASLAKVDDKHVSFLCGDAGPLAIGAVIFHKQQKVQRSKDCITRLLAFMSRVASHYSQVPDELLYGRVGYLYSLHFVNKYIPGAVSEDNFKQVVMAVIASGQSLSKNERLSVPLMYEWHEDFYLGGAHGVAGIMYILLQSREYMTQDQLQMVRSTIDFLLSIRYSSGNFPSSLGSNTDRLVHWCHGAPGTVQMLCSAYQAFGDERYLKAAQTCGDVVWERGILRKGYGICHGVAGNAYTFLILYQLTHDMKHLYRACKFAEWCRSYNQFQERVPDRPYSLFEGLAGTIYFLTDIQEPLQAKFPCFTL